MHVQSCRQHAAAGCRAWRRCRAALATDVAPHWVGGFVDWGDDRVVQEDRRAELIEFGDWYGQFFRNLVAWAGVYRRV